MWWNAIDNGCQRWASVRKELFDQAGSDKYMVQVMAPARRKEVKEEQQHPVKH
jgi:hypothetical protein